MNHIICDSKMALAGHWSFFRFFRCTARLNEILPLMILCMVLLVSPAAAQNVNALFRTWLEQDLWPEAKSRGISKATFDASFSGVRPNLDLPDLVMPGQKPKTPQKQHQAEFGSPGNYFAEKTISAITSGGRARAGDYQAVLKAIEKHHSVPAAVILAIWGRESGFGKARIPYDAFEVLGTKAFMSTRREMFRKEVLAALEIVERGLARRDMMKSSWAGALGQPQFLPTSFLQHAVDSDGDGIRDIWNSIPDLLASIAAYLTHHGWEKGRDWGFEVTIPQSANCALEGPDRGRMVGEWERMGIARVNGKPFPAAEERLEGYLLMPAGRSGPAFIVTPNFYVLKEYNESDLYALFIGHASDRIAFGDRSFAGQWGNVGGLYRSDIALLQKALESKGYDVGGVDGLPGFRTRRSIGEWQVKNGQVPTCFPDRALIDALG